MYESKKPTTFKISCDFMNKQPLFKELHDFCDKRQITITSFITEAIKQQLEKEGNS
jgi:hypothetical protein